MPENEENKAIRATHKKKNIREKDLLLWIERSCSLANCRIIINSYIPFANPLLRAVDFFYRFLLLLLLLLVFYDSFLFHFDGIKRARPLVQHRVPASNTYTHTHTHIWLISAEWWADQNVSKYKCECRFAKSKMVNDSGSQMNTHLLWIQFFMLNIHHSSHLWRSEFLGALILLRFYLACKHYQSA